MGLFRAAIMQSGTCDMVDFFRPYQQAQDWSKTFARQVGCDPEREGANLVTCLRKLSTAHMMDFSGPPPTNPYGCFIPRLYPAMNWGVTIDGSPRGLPDSPLKVILSGNYNNVTVIAGHNKDEGTLFSLGLPLIANTTLPYTEDSLNKTFQWFFRNSPAKAFILDNLFKIYPIYQYKLLAGLSAAVIRDYVFRCSGRRALTALANAFTPVYMYHFTYAGDWVDSVALGDYHASELPYVWANEWPPILHTFTHRDHEISDSFGLYWGNHCWFGNPNGNGTGLLPTWPRYSSITKLNIVLDVPVRVEELLGEGQCGFWDQVYQREI